MTGRLAIAVALLTALTLAACGAGKQVNASGYTCGEFSKSLRTKGDNSAGNFLNKLRDQAKLGQDKQTELRELTLGIFFACRGKPASARPAGQAVTIAKQIRDHKFKLPKTPGAKKKPSK
jgi:predicted small secreted protein